MKKILYVASTYSHIKMFHLPYINELKKDNIVDVLANGQESDININFKKRLTSITNLFLIFRLKKIIKANEYDWIILNTSLASFLVRMALKGIKKRPKVINMVHGYLFYGKSLKQKVMLDLEKILRKQTDYIITMNDYDYQIAKEHKLFREKIFNISGVGVSKTSSQTSNNPFSNDKFNLLYAAELSNRKNQMFLLKCLVKLKEEIPNIKLTLIGKGKNYSKYKKYIERNNLDDFISLEGFIDCPSCYFKNCDLYVSSSKCEGLPFNILNAVEYNKPIICSNIKGHIDINEVDNYLCLYNDETDFIQKVEEAYSNQEKKDGEKTFSYFEFSRVFPSNIKLINSIINPEEK